MRAKISDTLLACQFFGQFLAVNNRDGSLWRILPVSNPGGVAPFMGAVATGVKNCPGIESMTVSVDTAGDKPALCLRSGNFCARLTLIDEYLAEVLYKPVEPEPEADLLKLLPLRERKQAKKLHDGALLDKTGRILVARAASQSPDLLALLKQFDAWEPIDKIRGIVEPPREQANHFVRFALGDAVVNVPYWQARMIQTLSGKKASMAVINRGKIAVYGNGIYIIAGHGENVDVYATVRPETAMELAA